MATIASIIKTVVNATATASGKMVDRGIYHLNKHGNTADAATASASEKKEAFAQWREAQPDIKIPSTVQNAASVVAKALKNDVALVDSDGNARPFNAIKAECAAIKSATTEKAKPGIDSHAAKRKVTMERLAAMLELAESCDGDTLDKLATACDGFDNACIPAGEVVSEENTTSETADEDTLADDTLADDIAEAVAYLAISKEDRDTMRAMMTPAEKRKETKAYKGYVALLERATAEQRVAA